MPQDARRHAAGNGAIGDRSRHDGAGGDHRVAADVGEDHGGAADPGAGADADRGLEGRLIANRHRRIVDAVRVRAARHVHAGAEQRVLLDMHPAEMAARSDVGAVADRRRGRRKQRAEFDGRGARARLERARQERAPQVLAEQAGHERPRLRRAFERAIGADHQARGRPGHDRWRHDQPRERVRGALERLTHGRRPLRRSTRRAARAPRTTARLRRAAGPAAAIARVPERSASEASMAARSRSILPIGTMRPCTPSCTSSAVPPAAVATIGVSSAIASSTALGVPS